MHRLVPRPQAGAVAVVLVLAMMTTLADCQGLFSRTPRDGDACTTFMFTSTIPAVARILRIRVSPIPCGPGKVVNSAGDCVAPEDSDRCQPTVLFDEAYLKNRCARNPTMKFADPYSCTNYYDCSVGVTSIGCPVGSFYNDVSKKCDIFTEVECGERPVDYSPEQLELICNLFPNKIIIRANVCNSFYNCSMRQDPLGQMAPYHGECPYLQLLDAETKRCRPFDQVQCNDRREIKNPCELDQFSCGRSSHCRPCFVDQPDCTNLPDGDNPFPGQLFTPKYARCQQGRSLGVGTCTPVSPTEPRLFDPRMGGCASVRSIPRSLGGAGAEVGSG